MVLPLSGTIQFNSNAATNTVSISIASIIVRNAANPFKLIIMHMFISVYMIGMIACFISSIFPFVVPIKRE